MGLASCGHPQSEARAQRLALSTSVRQRFRHHHPMHLLVTVDGTREVDRGGKIDLAVVERGGVVRDKQSTQQPT
jgi:hypothetical protein